MKLSKDSHAKKETVSSHKPFRAPAYSNEGAGDGGNCAQRGFPVAVAEGLGLYLWPCANPANSAL